MPSSHQPDFFLADRRVRPELGRLEGPDGSEVAVEPRSMEVLQALARSPGRVIRKERLIREVWGDAFITDDALTHAVWELRKALGDDARAPRFIQTLPRRGYRLVAPVRGIATSGSGAGDGRRPLRRYLPAMLLIVIAIVLLLVFTQRRPEVAEPPTEPSSDALLMVVLPFDTLGPDPSQEYLGAGLADELSAYLGSLDPDRLRLIARTSAMQVKRAGMNVEEIGRQLGVDYIIEGTIQRHGEEALVNARLIAVKDQAQLWGGTYRREIDDLFAMQKAIAGRVAGSLAIELQAARLAAVEASHSGRSPAYDAYLKGWYYWNHWPTGAENVERSISSFRQAVELDPEHAPSWAGLAAAYHLQATAYLAPPREVYPKAKQAVREALELDDSLARAHTSRGFIRFQYDWDWAAADDSFRRGLELGPGQEFVHSTYALYLTAMGRFEEALGQLTFAIRLDPLSKRTRWLYAGALADAGHLGAALRQYERLAELRPDNELVLVSLGKDLQPPGEGARSEGGVRKNGGPHRGRAWSESYPGFGPAPRHLVRGDRTAAGGLGGPRRHDGGAHLADRQLLFRQGLRPAR